jgi:VanZ family protein
VNSLLPLFSRWIPPIAWMAVIFILSAQPGLRVSDDASVDGPIRQIAHVVTYGVLAFLLLRALTWGGTLTVQSCALALGIAILYGVTDEIHQSTVPDRTGQAADLVWDGLGAVLGVVAYVAWKAWRTSRSTSTTP